MAASALAQWCVGANRSLPRIMVLDGGVSTHLESIIGGSFAYKELWSSSLLLNGGRDQIVQGHRDWIQAKANVISTVTYQLHFEASQWPKQLSLNDEKITELWKDGIQLARTAQQEENSSDTFVLASSGCYGAALSNGAEYTGDYGVSDDSTAQSRLQEFHRRKLHVAQTADLTAIETVPSLAECKALAQLLLEEPYSCYISLSCRNGTELNDGTHLDMALKEFRDVPNDRLVGIGLNCCAVEHMKSLLAILLNELARHHPPRGIVLYPNSGETWDSATATWLHDGSEDQVLVSALMDRIRQIEEYWDTSQHPGILVGGCCRTTPTTIKLLQEHIQSYLADSPSD